MIFSTYGYLLVFLPVVFFLIYNRFSQFIGESFQLLILILVSAFFYAYWDVSLFPLLVGSILFNYFSAVLMDRFIAARKAFFVLGIAGNLLFLGYFKYFNFFAENYNSISDVEYFSADVALPLAISFYTLQQIAFLVDYYQKFISEELSLKKYFGFIMFFPQLIAGPIVHYKYLTSQFTNNIYRIDYRNISLGLLLISIGLFKKVVLGDNLAPFVNFGYQSVDDLTLVTSWILAIAFYLQIYFDFSGYADLAIGSALLLNIKLPLNFNSPYKSKSLIEFWSRWHITLSEFLNHYLYVPLLRSWKAITFTRAMITTLFVMLVSGVWHGAGWGFIIWGALHGIGLIVNHVWSKTNFRLPKGLPWVLTNIFVIVALVLFRAADIKSSFTILGNMFGFNGIALPVYFKRFAPEFLDGLVVWKGNFFMDVGLSFTTIFMIIIGFVIALGFKNSTEMSDSFEPNYKWLFFIVVILFTSVVSMGAAPTLEFIYYEF